MHYRDKMFMLINDIIGGDEGGFAAAMLCGDKTELSKQTKLTVYRSGIGHIFSVSGTHVVIISAMIGWLVSKLSSDKRVTFAVQTVAVWTFAVFAGLSVSVVRAAVMLTLVSAAPLFFADLTLQILYSFVLLYCLPFAICSSGLLIPAVIHSCICYKRCMPESSGTCKGRRHFVQP